MARVARKSRDRPRRLIRRSPGTGARPMKWSRRWLKWVGSSVFGGLLLAGGAFGEADLGLPRDLSKGSIEAPVKRVVNTSQAQPAAPASRASDRPTASANPKVPPGKRRGRGDLA